MGVGPAALGRRALGRDDEAAAQHALGIGGIVQHAGLAGGDAFFQHVEHQARVVVDQGQAARDGFAGRAPDLGAYEVGQPLPVYGPRGRTATRPFYW